MPDGAWETTRLTRDDETGSCTDFTLNWLVGIAFGHRVHRRSRNPLEVLYRYVWARDDPNARGKHVKGVEAVLQPWVTSLCVFNAVFTCMVELFVLIGMLQEPRSAWLAVPALLFPARAVIEMIYGSQLIWGPGRARGVRSPPISLSGSFRRR